MAHSLIISCYYSVRKHRTARIAFTSNDNKRPRMTVSMPFHKRKFCINSSADRRSELSIVLNAIVSDTV